MTVYIQCSKPSTNSQNQWLNLARLFHTWLIYKNRIRWSRKRLKVWLTWQLPFSIQQMLAETGAWLGPPPRSLQEREGVPPKGEQVLCLEKQVFGELLVMNRRPGGLAATGSAGKRTEVLCIVIGKASPREVDNDLLLNSSFWKKILRT